MLFFILKDAFMSLLMKISILWNSLGVQWLELCAFTAEGPGWPQVGELRSHKPYGMGKKKKHSSIIFIFLYFPHFTLIINFTNCYMTSPPHIISLPCGSTVKNLPQCRIQKRLGFYPWVRRIPWSKKWQPALVFLPGKFHRQRSLVGYRPWGHKELDTTEHTHTHF